MNLYHLRYFETLAGIQHYTKAAEELSIAQPSLSHAIAQLEEELGVPLFAKNGRNVVLTPAGEEFLQSVRQALSTLDAGIEAIQRRNGSTAKIRLGFATPMGVDFVPRMTAGFLQLHPEAQFSFQEENGAKLLDGLRNGEYDAVFCETPENRMEFEVDPVCMEHWVLVTEQSHPLSRRSAIAPEEFAKEKLILAPKGTIARKAVDRFLESVGIRPQITYEAASKSAIAGLVAQGLGVTLTLSGSAAQMSRIACVPIDAEENVLEFSMMRAKKKFMPLIAQRFCRYVKNYADAENETPDSSVK